MQPKSLLAPALLGLAVLGGCVTLPPDGTETDACGAAGYIGLVGTPLAAVTMPADLDARIIQPGMAVTQDFRPGRLNIDVNSAGTITRVYCG